MASWPLALQQLFFLIYQKDYSQRANIASYEIILSRRQSRISAAHAANET